MEKQNLQDIVTGKVRLSYVHLFKPHAHQQGAEPKYSTTILVPKWDIATKQRMDRAIYAAIQEGISSKWNGVRPTVLGIPVYDGDGVRPSDGMPFGEECKGHWVLTAYSKQGPQVVDLAIQPILNEAEVYSGIYARVYLSFFPYSSNGKDGIGCGLGPVQKLEDGEPLGGRVSAAEAFGDGTGGFPPSQIPAYPSQQIYSQQPPYNSQQSIHRPIYQQPVQADPNYQQTTQQAVYSAPTQMGYPQQPVQIDPITGAPISGGVMGL
jgi:hypothetical protein